MPREELDAIQGKLKAAIQNHQNVVAKLKKDPQNENFKTQLRYLQSEITSLSDQQRIIVQKLRSELIQKNQTLDPPSPHQPQPAHQQTRGPPAAHTGSPPLTLHSPLSPVFGDLNSTNVFSPADLSVKSPPIIDKPQPKKLPIRPKPIDLKYVEISPKQGGLPKQEGPPTMLRVPSVDSVKDETKTELDKPLYINTAQLAPQIIKELSDKLGITATLPLHKVLTVHEKKIVSKEKRKLDFMASMDLITIESVKELQQRRNERKRRSTANPQFAYQEPEKRRIVYLMSPPASKRTKDKSNHLLHGKLCVVCNTQTPTPFLLCDICQCVYHNTCLKAPVSDLNATSWTCHTCETNRHTSTLTAENLALIHQYISSKAAREEEKRKLQKRSIELINEKLVLENRTKELTDCLNKQVQEKQELIAYNNNVEESVNNLKNFVKVFQS